MARRHGLVYWQKHLAAWSQSGLTQEAYCTQNGLSTKSFYRWRHSVSTWKVSFPTSSKS